MALLDLTKGAVEKRLAINTTSSSQDYSKIKEIYPGFGKISFNNASNPDLLVNKNPDGLDINT